MATKQAQAIPDAALNVLANSILTENPFRLTLPPTQLDRKLYVQVNEALERLGGKWNTKQKVHLFEDDPTFGLQQMLATGMMSARNPLDFYATPEDVANAAAALLDIEDNLPYRVLEPSAGTGAMLTAILKLNPNLQIDCIELDPKLAKTLKDQGYNVTIGDFLTTPPPTHDQMYDRVIMNPPFTAPGDSLAYEVHITRAFYNFLKPRGILVAVTPSGWQTRQDKRCQSFREFVDLTHETIIDNGHGAFAESGTGVSTTTIKLIDVF